MSASRLKGKPLLEINNLPIICHVVKKAKETGIGKVIVATEDKEIVTAVKKMMVKLFLQEIIKLELTEYLKLFKN
jgi:CMP-2-keto-3-deoxyoctulosonic acid synthetase